MPLSLKSTPKASPGQEQPAYIMKGYAFNDKRDSVQMPSGNPRELL